MKIKPATITLTDEEGNVIKEIPMTLADDDWIRAGRLADHETKRIEFLFELYEKHTAGLFREEKKGKKSK